MSALSQDGDAAVGVVYETTHPEGLGQTVDVRPEPETLNLTIDRGPKAEDG